MGFVGVHLVQAEPLQWVHFSPKETKKCLKHFMFSGVNSEMQHAKGLAFLKRTRNNSTLKEQRYL
jgi:hypothetical protein